MEDVMMLAGRISVLALAAFGAVCLYWCLADNVLRYWSPRQRMIRRGRK